LECGKGLPLYSFLSDFNNADFFEKELFNILFQVIYTIEMMNQVKLTHYDLHLGNIFLEDLSQYKNDKKKMIYFLSEDEYVVLNHNRYFAKIFDFDFAYARVAVTREQSKSREIRYCPQYGICSQHDTYQDLHCFLILLLHDNKWVKNKRLEDFIKGVYLQRGKTDDLNIDLYSRVNLPENFFINHLCEIKKVGGEVKCDGIWKHRPNVILSPKDAIRLLINMNPGKFKIRKLPDFDSSFFPGTYGWLDCVFGKPEHLEKARKYLEKNKIK
jgi:hypothetical protein